LLLEAFLLISCFISGQVHDPVFVDDHGVMRWSGSKKEVTLFGVNYTTPFAHAFRAHEYLDLDHKKAIDADVYHLARMGLNAYRCHIWDSEISDSVGNLIVNRHLDLFDYLLYRLNERGIKSILTPLKFGSNGYPEPDTPSTGFSDRFGKDGCLNNPESWPYQERYLISFLEHVNPYTGLSYKDDPGIIAFEINNEPKHRMAEPTRGYLDRMIMAIRSTCCKKPVFYNMSHNFHLTSEFINAEIQGGSFQWYPSGLVANHEQQGNFLPYVEDYPVPFAENKKFRNKARIIYEFDPADIGRSYMYPAMARTFRESGFQFAAQFAYDPVSIAYANTEYQTHYMNLAYAPQKALSLMIASEVFRRLPMYQDYGIYPENLDFDVFRVSYREDLAEMVTEGTFLYTNTTASEPLLPDSLKRIAGLGNSSIVEYEGTGAYFLDRIGEGTWRLEVMPDAVWVRDPFEKASLDKTVSVIIWREWPMSIRLPDLGEDFTVRGINDGNTAEITAQDGLVSVNPGTYLVTRKGITPGYKGNEQWKNIRLDEFYAPNSSCDDLYLLHKPVYEYSVDQLVNLKAKVVSESQPEKVEISYAVPGKKTRNIEMKYTGGYNFELTLPDVLQNMGFLEYHISVLSNGKWMSWPSLWQGHPAEWDFITEKSYRVRVVESRSPIHLFIPAEDIDKLSWHNWNVDYSLIPGEFPGRDLMIVRKLQSEVAGHSFRLFVNDRIADRQSDLEDKKRIVISGRTETTVSCPLQLAVVMDDGTTYGGYVSIGPEKKEYYVAIDQLTVVPLVLIPEGFPAFLPRTFTPADPLEFDINRVELIQVTIGPKIPGLSPGRNSALSVEGIWLE